MAERTLEEVQNASFRSHRPLLPLHDSLGVFTDALESCPDERAGGSAARGMAPSAAVAPRHSGNCSFPYRSLYVYDWEENYNVHRASAQRLFSPGRHRCEGGARREAKTAFPTQRSLGGFCPWIPAA